MPSLPYDYGLEAEDLTRRQKLLDALQAQAMQEPARRTPGNTSFLTPFIDILEQRKIAKDTEQLKADRAAAAQRYNEGLRSGMEAYEQTARGQELPGPNPTGPAGVQIPGDPRKAIFDALATGHPMLQEFAMKQLAEQGRGQLTPKDLLPYAAPEAIPGMLQQGAGGFKPKPADLKEVGGVVYDPSKRETVALGGPKPTQATIGGDLYELNPSTGQWKKLDNAPRITTNVGGPTVLMKGQSELATGRAKAANEDLAKAEAAAAAGQQALSTLQKMRETNQTYQGPAAGAAMWMGQLASSMGLKVDQRKLANSETFESESAKMWINMMEQAGGGKGLVKEESDRIAKAVPQLIHTPQGREQLFAMIEARAQDAMNLARTKQKAMGKAAAADNPNLYFEALSELGTPTDFTPRSPVIQGRSSGVVKWGDLK